MRRISRERFNQWNYEATAIRIKDGEFYFLGWNEDNGHIYATQNSDGIYLEKDQVMLASLYRVITETDEYNSALSLVLYDDDSELFDFINPHRGCENDYDIFVLTTAEWHGICDSLADGDYLIVIED